MRTVTVSLRHTAAPLSVSEHLLLNQSPHGRRDGVLEGDRFIWLVHRAGPTDRAEGKESSTRMWEEAIKRPLGDVRGGVW